MSKKSRMTVPGFWVLVSFVILQDSCSASQFCTADQADFHRIVSTGNIFSENTVRHCTVNQSCDSDNRMTTLTSEQKLVLSKLYRNGRKVVKTSSHIEFLKTSLELKVIPKCFKVKSVIPGNFQDKFDQISFQSIQNEKNRLENKLKAVTAEFEKAKNNIRKNFSPVAIMAEFERVDKHLNKITAEERKKKDKKVKRDITDVTLAHDDVLVDAEMAVDDSFEVRFAVDDETDDSFEVTFACDDETTRNHRNFAPTELLDDTLVIDDDVQTQARKQKKKRKFKRRYNQPQPRRVRTRRRTHHLSEFEQDLNVAVQNGWNGIVKNISEQPVSRTEEYLFSKGKKFCPVEQDPPIIRMQKELNGFFRTLRIQWLFYDNADIRTELETKFYKKSDWVPPKAGVEIEQFIQHVQNRFDAWKPPQWIRDNLNKQERHLMSEIKGNNDMVYLWEDKGASFTKMRMDQYISAGENELAKTAFYEEIIDEDPSQMIKAKIDELIGRMFRTDELTEKVSDFLISGGCKLSSFYHLLKTHKMPCDEENISDWLSQTGFPIRGIISGRGAPTERLAGFIDHFLQPGMKNLGTFLQDTKHTLKIIEEINDQIDQGEFSLDGIGLVTMDIESMYNNITEDLGLVAAEKYLNCRQAQDNVNFASRDPTISTSSLMEGLKLCLRNNYFKFNGKIYKQKGGVGTGIKLAPPYACLAVGDFEEKVFGELSAEVGESIKLWKRFIDDIFLLFRGSKEMCEELVGWLNNIMPGVIKLKSEYSTTCVEFLDLKIMIENGKLVTDLYIKPTNLQLYLDYRSNHPEPCKNAIVYCQALRIVERCSQIELAEPHLEQLKASFLKRHYPEKIIDSQIEKARGKDRKELIHQNRKKKNTKDTKVRLIFTNNESNPPIHKWLREGKKFLK